MNSPPSAEIVSVGTEILLGQIVDSNAAILGRLFAETGIGHRQRQVVGDNLERLTEALRLALSRNDIVVTIGGLGPTQDDLTRDGIALALDDPLVLDDQVAEGLRRLFRERGLQWVESQTRQALRPTCAETIPNPHGTAPGLVCRKEGKVVLALPGPPAEFVPMVEGPVRELLERLGGGEVIHSRVLRTVGLGESVIEARLADLIEAESPTVATYAKPAEVHVRVTARASSRAAAEESIEPVVATIRARLGNAVYGEGEETLEACVLDLYRQRGETIATAESCTGGMLGMRLTSIAGSSDVYWGGVVTYANEAKQALLGVSERTLAEHGAVSAECACEMAAGARERLGIDCAVSITGLAGPGGGSDAKPVGLVFIGIADANGASAHEYRFRSSRDAIRLRSTQAALMLLRERILGP